jgi:hypothetical protein
MAAASSCCATARPSPREAPVTMDKVGFMSPSIPRPGWHHRCHEITQSPVLGVDGRPGRAGRGLCARGVADGAAFAPALGAAQRGPAPWQIERGPNGELRAFGLQLPGSTLADAVQRWGDDLQVALIASRGQPVALEAYTDRWAGGGITGKLVLATDAQSAAVTRWQERSTRHERIDADAQRWGLRPEDRDDALRSRIVG